MIVNEGVKVVLRGDSSSLLNSFNQAGRGGKLFAASMVTALGAVAVQSAKMASRLEQDLKLVATLGGEAAQSTERLRKEVQQLGIEFNRDFNEIAQANYQAVSGGFKDIAGSIKITAAATKLATAGNADLVSSTDVLVKTLNAYSRSSAEAEKTASQLWAISRDGIITVEQLGRFMQDLPITARSSGLEFHELAAAISVMTAAGVSANGAMDQLRSALIKTEIEGFGGSLIQRVERFVGKGIGELSEILGDQTAARGMLVLAQNVDKFRTALDGAQETLDDFNEAADLMNSTTANEWGRLWKRITATMSDFGTTLNNIVTPAVKRVNDAFERGNKMREAHRRLVLENQGITPFPTALEGMSGGTYPRTAAQATVPPVSYTGPLRPFGMSVDTDPWGNNLGISRGAGAMPQFYLGDYAQPMGWRGFGTGYPYGPTQPTGNTTIPSIFEQFPDFPGAGRRGKGGGQQIGKGAQLAAQAVNQLAFSLTGPFVNALGEANSGVASFVAGLLQSVAQMAAQSFITSFIPGFNQVAAVAGMSSGPSTTSVNVNVGGGGTPPEIAAMAADGVLEALREARITGSSSLYESKF